MKNEIPRLKNDEGKFPSKLLEDVIVVGKVRKSKTRKTHYVMFDVTDGNYTRIKKFN